MKRLILFFLAIFLFLNLSGEEKNKKIDVSLNGGLTMKFSALGSNRGFLSPDTNFAYLIGFKAASVFNKSWYLGGAAFFLGNEINHISDTASPSHLSLGYGGVTAGYTFNIKSFFRIETGALIGGGRFSAQNLQGQYYYRKSFFALEPEINLLFVITRYFAASINFSYRLITGMNSDSDYDTADMSGPTAGLDLRLGRF